jgi:toxin ParE1/3/4
VPAEILKRPQALRDIEECFVYIAEDNLDAGFEFLSAIEQSFQRLAEFPFIGKKKEFMHPEFQCLRMWPVSGFENYLIFYAATKDVIEIVRLLYSSRDIEELFE